jgi:ubiquitin C-terminal hydrolase
MSSGRSHRQFHETKKKVINPCKTVQSVTERLAKYKAGDQEDAHEFLMDYLQELHEETKTEQPQQQEKTPVSGRSGKSQRLSNLRLVAEGEAAGFRPEEESGRSDAGLLPVGARPPKPRRDPWKVFAAAEQSAVTDVCFGMLETRLLCMGCAHAGFSYEPFK